MGAPVITGGKVLPIDTVYFRSHYGDKFSSLLDSTYNDFLAGVISDVYASFSGVDDLWKCLKDASVRYDKTRLCYGLLTAWYIADLYPDYADGVTGSGGVPVKMKSIGGVKIQFNTDPSALNDALDGLKSNPFGYKAYMMIKSAALRLRLYV